MTAVLSLNPIKCRMPRFWGVGTQKLHIERALLMSRPRILSNVPEGIPLRLENLATLKRNQPLDDFISSNSTSHLFDHDIGPNP